ncbi:hypothetical protein K439DRAFT_1347802, partial [Ramaria rubella]
SSTRNMRIKRLWAEVDTQFACRWWGFFACLECLHGLDHQNPSHLWLLHILFLNLINDDCQDFQDTWNHHPMSGAGTNDMSPLEMRFYQETTGGKPMDEFTGVHPDILNRYCGDDDTPSEPDSNEADSDPSPDHGRSDEADSDAKSNLDLQDSSPGSIPKDEYQQVQGALACDLQGNIKHKAVKVPQCQNPFAHDKGLEAAFREALDAVLQDDALPEHLFVQEEWESGEYPTCEALKCGSKGKELTVELPQEIWLPCVVAWAQSLFLMNDFMYSHEDNI